MPTGARWDEYRRVPNFALAHCCILEVDVLTAFEIPPGQRFRPTTGIDALRVVRAQGRRSLEPGQTALEVGLEPKGAAHREVDEGIEGIEIEATLCVGAGQGPLASDIVGMPHGTHAWMHDKEKTVIVKI